MLEQEIKKAVALVEEKINLKIQIPVKVNNRLKSTLGWYKYYTRKVDGVKKFEKPDCIEIAGDLVEEYVYEIVAHEAAHYFTSITVGLHDHDHPEFIRICNFLGTSFAPTASADYMKTKEKVERKKKPVRYECHCSNSACGRKMKGFVSSNAKAVKTGGAGYSCPYCRSGIRIYDNQKGHFLSKMTWW